MIVDEQILGGSRKNHQCKYRSVEIIVSEEKKEYSQ